MRLYRPLLFVAIALTLGGCQVLPVQYLAPGLAPVQYAWQLTSLSRAELDQELADSQQAWDSDPTPANRARLGLVRGQHGYAGYAPEQAAEDLLAAQTVEDADWSSVQAAFLQLRAAQLNHDTGSDEQLANAQAQIDALQNELARARAKLEAIGNIERELR